MGHFRVQLKKYHHVLIVLFFVVFNSMVLPRDTFSDHRNSFYSLSAKSLSGERIVFDSYKDKVVLAVNISLKCGTTPQLKALQELYQRYSNRGFVVLGFPSNDFTGELEPSDRSVIKDTCALKYGVKFPLFTLGSVRGETKQPVFDFLVNSGSEDIQGEVAFNFEKFLIDRSGKLRNRFGSFEGATSDIVVEEVEKLLQESGDD